MNSKKWHEVDVLIDAELRKLRAVNFNFNETVKAVDNLSKELDILDP